MEGSTPFQPPAAVDAAVTAAIKEEFFLATRFQPPAAVDAATTTAIKEGSFLAATPFQPPAAVDAAATTAIDAAVPDPCYASWALLDQKAYLVDHENATTAVAMTSTGHKVKVTFCLAVPPAVSYFCVHSPELEPDDFDVEPVVAFSEQQFVLLRFGFTVGPRSTLRKPGLDDYFVYNGGCGEPSLTPIPTPHPREREPEMCKTYPSILPCYDGEYLLADLSLTQSRRHYVLHIFSSKTKEWITRPLQLQISPEVCEEDLPWLPHKVIAFGEAAVGWIDLWRGIVVCNVLDQEPVLRFIPLPKPEFSLPRKGDPRQLRDVTFCNGLIQFIEMEHCDKPADAMEIKPKFVPDGWKIRTCYRDTSWNCWRKGHNIRVDEILVNNQRHSRLLPELLDSSTGKWTLKNLTAAYPVLSINRQNVVYLMSRMGIYYENTWVVGVDLEKKKAEVFEPYCSGISSYFETAFLPCKFSDYLNRIPRLYIENEDICAENYLPNDHLSWENIIQNNLHPKQNYYGSLDENPDDVHPRNGNCQLTTPVQPHFIPPPSLPQTVHPNLTSSGSGHLYRLNSDVLGQVASLPGMPVTQAFPFNTFMMPGMPQAFPFNPVLMMPGMPAPQAFPFNPVLMMPGMPAPQAFPFSPPGINHQVNLSLPM